MMADLVLKTTQSAIIEKRGDLAKALEKQHRFYEAIEHYYAILDYCLQFCPGEVYYTNRAREDLAVCHAYCQRYDLARSLLEEVLSSGRAILTEQLLSAYTMDGKLHNPRDAYLAVANAYHNLGNVLGKDSIHRIHSCYCEAMSIRSKFRDPSEYEIRCNRAALEECKIPWKRPLEVIYK